MYYTRNGDPTTDAIAIIKDRLILYFTVDEYDIPGKKYGIPKTAQFETEEMAKGVITSWIEKALSSTPDILGEVSIQDIQYSSMTKRFTVYIEYSGKRFSVDGTF